MSEVEYISASYEQRQFWLLHQRDPNSSAYNVPSHIHIRGDLDVAALDGAFQQVIARHDVYRTVFTMRENELYQKIAPEDTQAQFHRSSLKA